MNNLFHLFSKVVPNAIMSCTVPPPLDPYKIVHDIAFEKLDVRREDRMSRYFDLFDLFNLSRHHHLVLGTVLVELLLELDFVRSSLLFSSIYI